MVPRVSGVPSNHGGDLTSTEARMTNQIRLGDTVWTMNDWNVTSYIYGGKVGKKALLFLHDTPKVYMLVDYNLVWKK